MEAPLRSASCSSQLTAILKKNGRLKRRGWCTTCCEIVSPALFCCILLLGYSLSEVFVINAGLYASLKFDVAPLLYNPSPNLTYSLSEVFVRYTLRLRVRLRVS